MRERLLGGLSPRTFLRRHWQKRPLMVRGALPGFRGLLGERALAALAARDDVARPRLLGSILACAVKSANGGYQSAQSRRLRDWYLSHGLNIRPLGSTLYLMPPYGITDEELTRAYAGLLEGLDAVGG